MSLQVPQYCGMTMTAYEIQYSSLVNPERKFIQLVMSTSPFTVLAATPLHLNHTLHGLAPFTQYQVEVRVHGHWNPGNGRGSQLMLVSNFSDPVSFQTQEGGK